MDVIIQILCILISFIYGIFINLFIGFNKKIINKHNLLYEIIFRLIITLLVVLLYVIIIYKINKGIFHIYFIIMVFIGYIISLKKVK